MGRRPKQYDPWEGYEFIDISPREEGERPRQASSRGEPAFPAPGQPSQRGKLPKEAIPVPARSQGDAPRQGIGWTEKPFPEQAAQAYEQRCPAVFAVVYLGVYGGYYRLLVRVPAV